MSPANVSRAGRRSPTKRGGGPMLKPRLRPKSMRILLSSNHRYPGSPKTGSGLEPREWPSGSGALIHDLIAKGLAELGHEVFYRLPKGAAEALPAGVKLTDDLMAGVDVVHTMSGQDQALLARAAALEIPVVVTCHLDPTVPCQTPPSS